MTGKEHSLAAIGAFQGLADEHLAALEARLTSVRVARGEALLLEGAPSDALYIVTSGRFQVRVAGRTDPVAEIGPGGPVGEIGFFAGGPRTASVIALRDSLALKLDRTDFDAVAGRLPDLLRAVTETLARRLAAETAGGARRRMDQPRTLVLVPAGPEPFHEPFVKRLRTVLERTIRLEAIGPAEARSALGLRAELDGIEATRWFNAVEERCELVLYLTDNALTDWSRKAIRQADEVLLVGRHVDDPAKPVPLNEIERFVLDVHEPASIRLVLLHAQRRPAVAGTRHWLAERPVRMHHHVCLRGPSDIERLYRFVTGRALGLVACGGGAFCAVHVGLYQALCEAGLAFDIIGGTSGGGAMAAAFAAGAPPHEIDARLHDIFVTRRALRRWTWPRYALIDHKVLDQGLAEHYTDADIEDLWTPFFAVSTNLSRNELHVHRSGKLWQAVRATGAIPGLLPPFFTEDGEMLVDGALLDNVPVRTMRTLKGGPNVVISFSVPRLERFDVDYRSLPSRAELVRALLTPFGRARLPSAPGPRTVLMRSLAANRQDFEAELQPDDILIVPPIPEGMSILDWSQHSRLMADGHAFGRAELARLRASDHPILRERRRAPMGLTSGAVAGRAAD